MNQKSITKSKVITFSCCSFTFHDHEIYYYFYKGTLTFSIQIKGMLCKNKNKISIFCEEKKIKR